MSFEQRGEAVIGAHDLKELKLVYRVLHRHLAKHTELMDTYFLIELQNFLHAQASAAEGPSIRRNTYSQNLSTRTSCMSLRMRSFRRVVRYSSCSSGLPSGSSGWSGSPMLMQ